MPASAAGIDDWGHEAGIVEFGARTLSPESPNVLSIAPFSLAAKSA